jgi:hypothetical protein
MRLKRRDALINSFQGITFVFPFIISFRTSLFIIILFTLLGEHKTEAQNLFMQDELSTDLAMAPKHSKDTTTASDTAAQDLASMFTTTEPNLLPDRMSFGEKFFWGKSGLFREVGLVGPLTLPERKYEIELRRTMLTTHQIAGFTTLALMWTSAYFGQRVIDGNRRLGGTHQAFVTATILSYSITGLLAVLSPPPLIRRDEVGTVTIHKTLAWIHLAGMILTPIIGSMIRHRHSFSMKEAHFHQVAGYITTATFTAAVLVIVF